MLVDMISLGFHSAAFLVHMSGGDPLECRHFSFFSVWTLFVLYVSMFHQLLSRFFLYTPSNLLCPHHGLMCFLYHSQIKHCCPGHVIVCAGFPIHFVMAANRCLRLLFQSMNPYVHLLSLHAMPAVPHVQIGAQIGGTSSGVFCISMEKSLLCDHPWLIVMKAEEMVRSLGCTSVGLCVLLISFVSWRFNVTAHDCRHRRVRSQTRNFVFQTCHNIMFPRPAQVDRVQIAMTRLVVLGWIKKKTELLTCMRNYTSCSPRFILHKSSTCKWRRVLTITMITRPVDSLFTTLQLILRARVNEPWPISRIAKGSHHAETMSQKTCADFVPLETKWELVTQTNASP